ncbi:hypothetical protein K7X08_021131 [Anisodus acutangulus]|uniref:Uncharacterized protein n=1 Tax=Anisodus acutangulus TaxID=402998 RepID=A0A9Q1RBW8_9SOLA|nr:hypothetical protein K7X08_021131 [Anisodus acutangulus]
MVIEQSYQNLPYHLRQEFGGYGRRLLGESYWKKSSDGCSEVQFKWEQNANPSSYVCSHKQHAQRRLAFSKVDNLLNWSSSCSLVGSVLCKNDAAYYAPPGPSSCTLSISRILQNFKFLKVLDLENYVVIDFIPTDQVYLRYFSAQTEQMSIPSYISNLSNLETMIFKCRSRDFGTTVLPVTVREMVKLIHLHISDFSIEDAEELLENSPKLYDLETFSAPFFSCVEDDEMMLRKTPNLRKLICVFKGLFHDFEPHVLNFPTGLEMLKIYRLQYASKTIPFFISAPNLNNLKLSGFFLHPQHLSEIAQLQNLQRIAPNLLSSQLGISKKHKLKIIKILISSSSSRVRRVGSRSNLASVVAFNVNYT